MQRPATHVVLHVPVASAPIAPTGLCAGVGTKHPAMAAADALLLLSGTLASIGGEITDYTTPASVSLSPSLREYVAGRPYRGHALALALLLLSCVRVWTRCRLSPARLRLYLGRLVGVATFAIIRDDRRGSLVYGPDHLLP